MSRATGSGSPLDGYPFAENNTALRFLRYAERWKEQRINCRRKKIINLVISVSVANSRQCFFSLDLIEGRLKVSADQKEVHFDLE